MIDLELDPVTGDLKIDSFDLSLIEGVDQIAQNIAIRLRFFLGEWYLDVNAGVPYYQYFFIKNPNQIQVESFIKDEILGTDGVLQITDFASDYDGQNRTFKVNFTCQTENGLVEIEQELGL